ncbi:hypothetical protein Q9Q93_22670 (plasmid) [Enterobacter hormaechei]|uniref:hypothetical protein n=1 Tax=Enterobacter hormaechei TaxID=158836 RepID=UPI000B70B70B|nr:hypothetical protein [Enterobacter hormaechei]MCE1525652.1 hypothetical protein [Enterobacter hormaechei]OUF18815.1 hypothetical protein AZ045_004378 [Enterobacter hormaechei]WLR86750.1 hypothetical protein Q9Q93_22670 [Enterobacter hormaechei]
MANSKNHFDYSAPPPAEQDPTQEPQTESKEKASDEYLRQEERNDLERRVMRYCLFAVIMFFAIFFLSCGLFFALKVGDGLLLAKQNIVYALTSSSVDVSHCIIPVKCVPGPSRGISEAVANLNADWLSASSLIMLVAFILGVGLTLILTLLKSAFRHPTDNSSKDESNQTSLELATPLSELFSGIASYFKDKLSK